MDKGFAEFIKKRRKALGMSQRVFANRIGISYSYISSIESGKRPAPSRKVLRGMENELRLKPKERAVFEQLAVKTKADPAVSYDIAEYINNNEAVYNAVAYAQKNNIGEDDWKEFLGMIKEKNF